MPELPEVQTIVTDLQSLISDQFTDFFSDFPKAVKYESVTKFTSEIKGKKILSVERLGKIILFDLDGGNSVAVHLKMTGKLLLMEHETWNMQHKINKHFHHAFFLQNSGVLAFSDVRKFATITLLNEDDKKNIRNKYGIDPIADNFSINDLSLITEKRKDKPIKSILMDNSVILGIGNIYASEILFQANIAPIRLGRTLDEKEIEHLHSSIEKILTRAIRLRGTSVSDYRDSAGKKGSFQDELRVYKKHGQKCQTCGTIIEKMIIGQRSTFFCPTCQK